MSEPASPLHLAALWGDDHLELGEVATAALDERCALALSRGRHPKGYPYLDPNEDAVVAATDGTTSLLAVADGHSGFEAARAALRAVLGRASELLDHRDLEAAVREAFSAAREAIAAAVQPLDEPRRSSRTTLTVALVGEGRVATATRGDSVAVRIHEGQADLLGRRTEFLEPETDPDRLYLATTDLAAGDLLVLASDGLYDFLGRHWGATLAGLAAEFTDPEAYCLRAVQAAFAGGAGDNVAVACLSAA